MAGRSGSGGRGGSASSRSRPAGSAKGALLRSIESDVAAVDTLFVELAARSGCPLATFDAAVLPAFPEVARRPRDLQGP